MKCGSTQARGDAQIGFHEPAVELDRGAAGRRLAEIDMRRVVLGMVIDHGHAVQDPRIADDLRQFVPQVRPVQARGDKDGDVRRINAGAEQRLDHRPQEQAVGHGARDVADQDAGRALALCEVRKRRALNGCEERPPHSRVRIGENRHGRLGDDRHVDVVAEPNRQVRTFRKGGQRSSGEHTVATRQPASRYAREPYRSSARSQEVTWRRYVWCSITRTKTSVYAHHVPDS